MSEHLGGRAGKDFGRRLVSQFRISQRSIELFGRPASPPPQQPHSNFARSLAWAIGRRLSSPGSLLPSRSVRYTTPSMKRYGRSDAGHSGMDCLRHRRQDQTAIVEFRDAAGSRKVNAGARRCWRSLLRLGLPRYPGLKQRSAMHSVKQAATLQQRRKSFCVKDFLYCEHRSRPRCARVSPGSLKGTP
jgi:hypothetical protein